MHYFEIILTSNKPSYVRSENVKVNLVKKFIVALTLRSVNTFNVTYEPTIVTMILLCNIHYSMSNMCIAGKY